MTAPIIDRDAIIEKAAKAMHALDHPDSSPAYAWEVEWPEVKANYRNYARSVAQKMEELA